MFCNVDEAMELSASARRQVLQPAANLAALMQQYYALPAVAAERQLALAQAAAGRSCAYLRCANLGGEGGPAAGQGTGSMRCRCDVGWGDGVWAAAWYEGRMLLRIYLDTCGPIAAPLLPSSQRLPRGVVLRHRLLARRLAGGRAPPRVPGAGRCAAGGQGGGGGSSGSGSSC